MRHFKRLSSWLPLLAGLVSFAVASQSGGLALFLAALPSILLISGGGRMLLSPDMRAPQYAVLGSVLNVLAALPMAVLIGGHPALILLFCGAVSFVACGWYQIRMQPVLPCIPAPKPSLAYSAKVALDDGILASMAWLAAIPDDDELAQAIDETQRCHTLFEERGWLKHPETFHTAPPALDEMSLKPMVVKGFDCELLSFASDYQPPADMPGGERWLSYEANNTTQTLLLRGDNTAPWLVCIHGFGMGSDLKRDFATFRVGDLHRRFGVNIAMVTLPVHGVRSPGGFNGAKFMPLSPVDFILGEAQAIWDLRRLIGWLRAEGATKVGINGISLGAYTSALLASIEEDLACVVSGVPPSDVLATREHLMSSMERRLMTTPGLDFGQYREVQSVVRPLCFTPKVAHENRFIYAATGDQFVPLEQINALWQHWQKPRIAWCKGGHVSALGQKECTDLIDEAITLSLISD